MKQYAVFHPLFMSFFSKSLYRDVAKNWKGTGFAYLLLLLALAWIPVMIAFHFDLSDEIDREAPKIVNQIPKITVTKGEASVDAPVPYYIIDPKSGRHLMVIDTSGQIASLDQTQAIALLTKTQFMLRQKARAESRVYNLSQFGDFSIDREAADRLVLAFKKWFAFMAYPFAVIGLFIYRIIQVLVYALIGLIFANILKTTLDYNVLVRLSAVSITTVIILNALRRVFDVSIPYVGLLSFLIAMGYLFFAVKANAEGEKV